MRWLVPPKAQRSALLWYHNILQLLLLLLNIATLIDSDVFRCISLFEKIQLPCKCFIIICNNTLYVQHACYKSQWQCYGEYLLVPPTGHVTNIICYVNSWWILDIIFDIKGYPLAPSQDSEWRYGKHVDQHLHSVAQVMVASHRSHSYHLRAIGQDVPFYWACVYTSKTDSSYIHFTSKYSSLLVSVALIVPLSLFCALESVSGEQLFVPSSLWNMSPKALTLTP